VSTLENVYYIDLENYPCLDHCLGLQANLWTEHIHNQEELFAMLHPRAAALAARAWAEAIDFDEFNSQLQDLEAYYAAIFT
jgi:hexosaminidase